MPLVTNHAQAPWGPVSLRTAESKIELLTRLREAGSGAPAHIEDVGERDPAEVVRLALRLLPPPMDATGQIPATVVQASKIIAQTALRVPLAMLVAETPEIAVPGHPAAIAGHVDGAGEADCSVATANSSILALARRRPGAEVDVREIRAGLGMSQPAFAAAFGLKLAVLRDWEQGRTKPDGTAKVLLRVIEANPDVVRQVVCAADAAA